MPPSLALALKRYQARHRPATTSDRMLISREGWPRGYRAGSAVQGWDDPLPFVSMPPVPRLTGRELLRTLNRLGWVVVVQKGSQAQLKHPTRAGRVTVPLHAGETIGPKLLGSILAQAGLTTEELRQAL